MKFSLFLIILLHSVGSTLLCVNNFSHQLLFQTELRDLPIANQQIIEFVKSKLNTKVGRGECQDLASEALNYINAKWESPYKYGKEVNYKKEAIYPGDIIQFENIKIEYERNGVTYAETMPHHTAIIFQTISETNYEIAHQNNGFSGKKVGVSPIDLKDIKKGKFKIYRPEKQQVNNSNQLKMIVSTIC